MKLNNVDFDKIPNKYETIYFLQSIRDLLFPNYFCKIKDIDCLKRKCQENFLKVITDDENKMNLFFDGLKNIYELLLTDIEMTFLSDPASNSYEEVIITYPGIYAIITYRIAHLLYELGEKISARIMSEYAHSKTGIDIHPGAIIGDHFFIDHGTGIVIGETTIIGNHVKLYQGVTLGALSLSKGHELKNTKRHPTIGNYVTIYSNASILGGDTVVGDNVTVGGNVFITKSIPSDVVVTLQEPKLIMNNK